MRPTGKAVAAKGKKKAKKGKKKTKQHPRIVNRKAHYDYFILETAEAREVHHFALLLAMVPVSSILIWLLPS